MQTDDINGVTGQVADGLKLNELWYAGFSNPESICRLLLQLHKDDKRRRAELPPGGASAANGTAAAILEAAPEGAPG